MKTAMLPLIFGAVLASVVNPAFAQFGNLLKAATGGSSISADQIVQKYVAGSRTVVQSNATMLDAVGLKTEADRATAQAANLTEGATKDTLEETAKVQSDSSKALEAKLKDKNTTLDANGKKKFAAGLVDLAKGVIIYVSLGKDVTSFKPSVASLGGSAGSAMFVAKSLPGSTTNLAQTLKMAIDYCKTNNIPVPKEANDATAMI